MARTTHDRVRDHEGTDLDSNIVLDGATTNYADGEDLHTVIADLDTRAGSGGSGSTCTIYAECNTSPSGSQTIPFDTFYDVDANVIVSLPVALGMTYNTGTDQFDLDEDGTWYISLGAEITASPTVTGNINLLDPGIYAYAQQIRIAASGNLTPQIVQITASARAGRTLSVVQNMTGSHVFINGYALLTITRLASAIE